ncbi:hypothetical protein C1S86_11165 [Vibrio parahaemolyticus]|uniref:hypothetical protein n=1 Tax=Vibrio parahaemolyticus TaxID=670 RepID=UPI00099450FB|nr:hypothetical protein [Vibrio parahaemolyticus]OOQ70122.1 hypothetical protein BSR61_10035 [Vibrio parahaemolyticus]PMT76118.1 hypothetical protein C1S97_14110 [Vibrio parahaemolyticus]PMT81654.1 hypothetical protein C1S86_11165 [Vibrio parahaemolyticus]
MSDNPNDSREMALKFYDAARTELVERIRLRETILLFYITVIATLLGVAYNKANHHGVLLIIPYISFSIGYLLQHHNTLIGTLGRYCHSLHISHLVYGFDKPLEQWDNSSILREQSELATSSRFWPQAAILSIPSGFALFVNHERYDDIVEANSLFSTEFIGWAALWLGGVMTFFSVYFLYESKAARKSLFNEITEEMDEYHAKFRN